MTSSRLVSPISLRPAGKSIPITDIAASQSGQLVALTASVGSQPRWAQAPQLRQMRSKTIPVPAAIGARSPPRSTYVQPLISLPLAWTRDLPPPLSGGPVGPPERRFSARRAFETFGVGRIGPHALKARRQRDGTRPS